MINISCTIQDVSNLTSAIALSTTWIDWDGSDDGAVTNIATAGNIRGHDIAAVSDTEAVFVYRDTDNSWKAIVLDVDADTKVISGYDTNTPVTFTGTTPVTNTVFHMNGDKFVATSWTGNTIRIVLFSKSGKTLTILDQDQFSDMTYANTYCSTRINDTTLGVFSQDGATAQSTAQLFSIVGDNIVAGAIKATGATTDFVTTSGGICPSDGGDALWVVGSKKVQYLTFNSGTLAITVEDSIDATDGGFACTDVICSDINDTTMISVMESNGDVLGNYFQWNGSAIVKGTEIGSVFGADASGFSSGRVTTVEDNAVMFSTTLQNTSPKQAAVSIIAIESDDTLTLSARNVITSVHADHPTISATPSRDYVFFAYQDEDTSPDRQVGTRVLKRP